MKPFLLLVALGLLALPGWGQALRPGYYKWLPPGEMGSPTYLTLNPDQTGRISILGCMTVEGDSPMTWRVAADSLVVTVATPWWPGQKPYTYKVIGRKLLAGYRRAFRYRKLEKSALTQETNPSGS